MTSATNVYDFPTRESVIVTEGNDMATGSPLFLLEHVDADGRLIVGSYATLSEVTQAMIEWGRDGVEVRT